MVFTKFNNPAHDHAWHAQTILLIEFLSIPQSTEFLFETGPESHKMPALTQLGLQANCFTHPSAGRRVPFEYPCHFWYPYLSCERIKLIYKRHLPVHFTHILFSNVGSCHTSSTTWPLCIGRAWVLWGQLLCQAWFLHCFQTKLYECQTVMFHQTALESLWSKVLHLIKF
jgi:hypothetical protein